MISRLRRLFLKPRRGGLSVTVGQPSGNRQSGRTSAQISAAPRGAILIWPEPISLPYAINLARALQREDITVKPLASLARPHELVHRVRAGGQIVIDHAAQERLRPIHLDGLLELGRAAGRDILAGAITVPAGAAPYFTGGEVDL